MSGRLLGTPGVDEFDLGLEQHSIGMMLKSRSICHSEAHLTSHGRCPGRPQLDVDEKRV